MPNIDFTEIVDRINSITPEGLTCLQKARHGYVCPNPQCRDGSGKDGTGMTYYASSNKHYCGKCGRLYDNIDIFGFYYGLDPKTQFKELVTRIAESYNLGSIQIGHFSKEPPKPQVPDKHKGLILNANGNLKKFLDSQGGTWRGLTFDTLNKFQVGFLPNWFAREGAPSTPRIIIPTSFNHYLARLHGKLENFNIPDDVHLAEKEHRGTKEIFNYQAALVDSDDPICFLVEGEIDCMSCDQATASDFNFAAILGSDLATSISYQLKNTSSKNFIVMLDDDETGRKKAPILAVKLRNLGHRACVAFMNAKPHIQIYEEKAPEVKPKKLTTWDILPQLKREELLKIGSDLKTSDGIMLEFFKLLERNRNGLFLGLPLDVWARYGCRVMDSWTSPQSRVERKHESPTSRMLIPSSTDKFEPYYRAMKLVAEDDVEKLQRDRANEEIIRVGVPTLFNRKALQNDLVFAVEDEVDAMTIEFAGFHAVATCGKQPNLLLDELKKITNTPKIISLDSSIDVEKIIALGIPAVFRPDDDANITLLKYGMNSLKKNLKYIIEDTAEKFAALDLPERILPEVEAVEEKITDAPKPQEKPKFKDANEILQADPALLKTILEEIYSEAEKFFEECEDDLPEKNFTNDEIERWQETNGEINSDVLADLQSKANWIKNLQPSSKCEFDSTLQKALGDFRFYDFFADVAENFFNRLRDAKDAAKKKVSTFKKLSAHAETSIELRGDAAKKELEDAKPSDEENSLAGFDLAKFERAVNAFKTKAKREHKAWLAQAELDIVNAKIDAARKTYEENPPTVKDFVTDAPIDLVLPYGIFFDACGIRVEDLDKPPTKNGRPVVEAAQNIVMPVCIYREVVENDATPVNGDQYKIAIKNGGQWRYAVVPAAKLVDPNSVAELSKIGALISSKNFFAKAMVKIIAFNETNGILPVKKVYTQPGWHKDDDGKDVFIYPTGTEDYIVKNGGFDYKKTFTPHGDKDEWLKMFDRIIFHNPLNPDERKLNLTAAIIIGANAGTPLIKPLGIRNPQFNLGFDSGNGKTALGEFAVSFYGNPLVLVPTCNATQNFLENLAVKINDFPHAVDELQAAKKNVRENMDEFLYNFAGGETRGRADITGDARPTMRFRGCRTFTGEQSITTDASGQGALARIFEIKHSALFEDSFAVELHNFTRENFGFFGKNLTNFVAGNVEHLRTTFSAAKNFLTRKSGEQMLSSHVTMLAYALTGFYSALLSCDFLPAEEINKLCAQVMEGSLILLDDAPTKFQAKNINRALPDLLDYISCHPKNFDTEVITNGNPEFTPAEAHESFGVALKDGRIALAPSVLKRILNELGYPNANAIINGFGEAGYFQCSNIKDKYRKYQGKLPVEYSRFIGKTAWYYILQPVSELEDIGC
ncbi:MAG: DUF927 domain-containing protein [Clostridia bacterium]|nr:DUF927 domain-containing protein [Clostridia bacterium]